MNELDYLLSEMIPPNVKITLNPQDTEELVRKWLIYIKSQNKKIKIELMRMNGTKYAICSYSPNFEFTLKEGNK
jgi:hypothetical protein